MYLTHLKLSDLTLLSELVRKKKYAGSKDSERFLKESLIKVGMREPLLINDRHELIDGYRRYYAIKELQQRNMLPATINITKIPCVMVSTAGNHPATIRIQSDIRQDLTPSQEAHYYQKLLKEHNLKKHDLAIMIGISAMSISNYLVILDCIKPVQKAIDDGQLPMSAGKTFCVLKEDGQEKLYNKLKGDKNVHRKTLINQAKELSDDLFKRPKQERMKRSYSLRKAKKGQIQDGGVKRTFLLQDINVEEKELSYTEKLFEKARRKILSLIGWWDLIMRNETLRKYIKHKYSQDYNTITYILKDELGVTY
jgi:ParB/RepB/Spo0J family partition protein